MSSTGDATPTSTMIILPTSHEPRVDIPVWSLAPPWSNATPAVPPKPITFPVRRFFPPSLTDTPTSLFLPVQTRFGSRYMRLTDPREILIYADGTCVAKKTSAARAGCAFVFDPCEPRAAVAFRLENKGLDGVPHPQTSCRAELRAALAALRFRAWGKEGVATVVVAMDSAYAVRGIVERVWLWERYGWPAHAKHRDLWTELMVCVRRLESEGVQPMFWLIQPAANLPADLRAKAAAYTLPDREDFAHIVSVAP